MQYYYSIKEISVGGRCVCNGHAYVCPPSKENSDLLQCQCEHNTAGDQCDQCKEGYVQKKWRPYTKDDPFECERCNCNGHSDKCHYDQEVADKVSDSQCVNFKNLPSHLFCKKILQRILNSLTIYKHIFCEISFFGTHAQCFGYFIAAVAVIFSIFACNPCYKRQSILFFLQKKTMKVEMQHLVAFFCYNGKEKRDLKIY